MAGAVAELRGLNELHRALRRYGSDLDKELINELKVVAEPVRRDAVGLAQANIRNIGGRWSQMRIGVTGKAAVYVAPKQRSRNSWKSRPNLKPLLLNRAMEPALEQNRDAIYKRLKFMLDTIGARAGF